MRTAHSSSKEKILKAAVEELQESGVSRFSIRRVALRCNTTCAAPYKHFENKDDLLLEAVKYINLKWLSIWENTVEAHKDESLREQIVAVCMAYITFLCTYPEYQTVIFMNDKFFPPEVLVEKVKVSKQSERLIKEYCESVNMPADVYFRKKLAIRSLINGSAILINSGEIPFNSHTISIIKSNIEREFETE